MIVLVVGLLLSCLSRTNRVLAAPQLVAVLSAYAGHVQIERNGSTTLQAAIPQDALYEGDTIRTGVDGAAEILFTDGADVKLSHNSAIRITPSYGKAKSQSFIQAIVGVIWAHLRPGQTITAPTANIVVRGTEVAVTVLPNGTTQVTVIDGDIDFFNREGAVELGKSQQSTALAGKAPTSPITVDTTGLIDWTADVVGLPLDYETPEALSLPSSVPELLADESQAAVLVKANPASSAAWDRLGEIQRAIGDAGDAVTSFTTAESDAPNDTEAHIGLALIYLSQGQITLAESSVDSLKPLASALAVEGLINLETGRESDAHTDLEAAVAADTNQYNARALLGLVYLSQDSVGAADHAAHSAVKIAPGSALCQGVLASVLLFEHQFSASEKAAKMAFAINSRSPFVLLVVGRERMEDGEYRKASEDFEKAAAINPRLWLLHEELAESYLRLGLARKADEEYRIALVLNPNSAPAYCGLGEALEAEGGPVKPADEFAKAVAIAPDDPSIRYFYASYLIDQGMLDQAIGQIVSVKKQAANFGLLYSKLAEIYLYKQNLHLAEIVARKGVQALPQSAIAHYELGRVYSEEQHTYQAEQEFRIATTLDPNLESARYALGVMQEKTESGLLSSFSSIYDAALIGSPASSDQLSDLDTPGANERIQAEVLDPTAIRSATRSYGSTELDVLDGGSLSNDAAISYLGDTDGSAGVVGIDGGHQFGRGVRYNDDTTLNQASFIVGQKIWDGNAGYVLLGDYEQTDQGEDTQVQSSPYAAAARYHSQLTRLTGGFNIVTSSESRLAVLVQTSDALDGTRPIVSSLDPLYNEAHLNTESLDAEVRWNDSSARNNLITTGLSYGERRRTTNSSFYFAPDVLLPLGSYSAVSPFQCYFRDAYNVNTKLALTGQVQYIKAIPVVLDQPITMFDFPAQSIDVSKSFVLPYFVVSYASDASTIFRLRYQRIGSTVSDFELLNPVDDFLTSFVNFPVSSEIDAEYIAEGTSTEAEYDKTFGNASFLSVAAFDQHLAESSFSDSSSLVGTYPSETNIGVQASLQGAVTSSTTYFSLLQYNSAWDNAQKESIAQLPELDGLCTLQYLSHSGLYDQVSYYFQTARILSDTDRSTAGGFGIVDLRTGKRFGLRSNVFVELNNVTNVPYDVVGTLEPGRELRVGISQRY